jgi:FtsH-binding integral membrane protein
VFRRSADRLALGVVAGVTAVGVVLGPELPATVAVHCAAGGTPDGYAPRGWAVAAGPAVALATLLVLRGAARVDPPADPRSVDALVVGTTATLGAVYLLVLGWNLGYPVPMALVVPGAVVVTLALAGYVVVREVGG